jgi:5'-nucleotidase
MGHAVTLHEPLRLTEIRRFDGVLASYACSGTPVDSVKIARDVVLDRKPDICLSGINHGSNSSINVIYSGTMSAAVEAGIEAIPSVGFSLSDHSADADFEFLGLMPQLLGLDTIEVHGKGLLSTENIFFKSSNHTQGVVHFSNFQIKIEA